MNNSDSSIQLYDIISQEVIVILSEILKQKKQIGKEILSEMLAKNKNLAISLDDFKTKQNFIDRNKQIEDLKETIREQKKELFNIETETEKRVELFLKTMRTFSILIRTEGNPAINNIVEKINKNLSDKEYISEELVNDSLALLKKEILNMEVTQNKKENPKKSFFSEIFKSSKNNHDTRDLNDYKKSLKDFLLSLILRLQLENPEYSQQINSITEKIKKDSLQDLKSIKADIFELIGSFKEILDEDKNSLYLLVQEIATKLVDTEKELLITFSNNQNTSSKYNQDFHDVLSQEINGIETVFQDGHSIENIKTLVFEKLGNIKSSIKKKKEIDVKVYEENKKNIVSLTESLDKNEEELKNIRNRADLDRLTSVYNRGAFQDRLKKQYLAFKENGKPGCLIVMDIDNFKKNNDDFGFDNGDRILQALTKVITDKIPEEYFFARYGGGEFVVLLPGGGLKEGEECAEELRKAVMGIDFYHLEQKVLVTISLGVTEFSRQYNSIQILQRAHEALSKAKAGGKNQVSVI